MTSVRNDALNLALDTEDNSYLLDGYAPVDNEIGAENLEVIGPRLSRLLGARGSTTDQERLRWSSSAGR